MNISFAGKRALITGAGKGLGRETAKAFWAAGAITYALSRTQSDLDSLVTECPGIHTDCVDLSDWDAARAAVEKIGHVDLLVNNAGIYRSKPFLDITKNDFDETYDTNIRAIFNVSQVVARGMMERECGNIMNISSIYSVRGTPTGMLYNTAQGALDQLTRCMAVELGPHQIRVNSVRPNLIKETPMGTKVYADSPEECESLLQRTPLGRWPKVKCIVNTILYLMSDHDDLINGAMLDIDGGFLCT